MEAQIPSIYVKYLHYLVTGSINVTTYKSGLQKASTTNLRKITINGPHCYQNERSVNNQNEWKVSMVLFHVCPKVLKRNLMDHQITSE